MKSVYDEGWYAYLQGVDECPYDEGTAKWHLWWNGWEAAEDEDRDTYAGYEWA